jgi:cellulose biosynthesis protein BcsQ
MRVVALCNMKGGVGKTTTAVNLAHLAAAAGQRTLLWDLDPQAASSFAFRVRPRVSGFGRKSLEGGRTLADAIKQTDYDNLDLLPADFAYRKLDRLLGDLGKPKRVMTSLLETLGHDYDVVFLDCPAGFSLLTESLFAAADALLVPTIPTVLSLRTLAQLIKWAGRAASTSDILAFFSMADRRKSLHRRACEWSAGHKDIFLAAQVPYASVVEQMAVRRMPLAAFAARDPATMAFAAVREELQARLQQRHEPAPLDEDTGLLRLRAIESLIARLESAEAQEFDVARFPDNAAAVRFVHTFDTDRGDLRRYGYALTLLERAGSFTVVAARSSPGGGPQCGGSDVASIAIDAAWAMQILSGTMSPLGVIERRLGTPTRLIESIRAIVGSGQLRRLESRVGGLLSA